MPTLSYLGLVENQIGQQLPLHYALERRHQPRAEIVGGVAVQPACGGGGAEGVEPLRKKTGDKPGQHVAAAGGGEIGRGVGVDDSAPIGRRDHGVSTLQQHDRARQRRGGARSRELVAACREETGEFTVMRRQHARAVDGGKQRRRLLGKDGERVGVEHYRARGR